ncbi:MULTISPECIES: hypothetical protein [unclassified Sphingobium]|uniref:hypothetical protein n=1 Tax=unclassified Sphingobium TaxID=2611147 RepID=UPI000D17C506|nr:MULTISPECIES: hypothetical protein [unclassified Sphingobium]MBG6120037.1 putative transcriptional regulator [Sphingobium sp. JAI105]PSO12907.1 hypothetical protein C7E20_03925 [Sphingobium sp. AEW4]TWD05762.1 hypothetical protein FB595_109122 [Sphingobium sp. AEW010]TWD23315.1 hypothetical protein FB596_109122 [Sphingobium sp. AEW013]TWD25175.1 hypothetical protein FB594_109122 [Sphingobium sp. AEW001]
MHSLNLRPAMSALLRYYSDTGEIPSRAGLAELWGYRSRAWADRVAKRLVETEFLVRRANGRLAPGPCFDIKPADVEGNDATARDPLPTAVEVRALALMIAGTGAVLSAAEEGDRRSETPSFAELMLLDMLAGLDRPESREHEALRRLGGFSPDMFQKVVATLVRAGLIDANMDAPALTLTEKGRALAEARASSPSPALDVLHSLGVRDRLSLLRVIGHVRHRLESSSE